MANIPMLQWKMNCCPLPSPPEARIVHEEHTYTYFLASTVHQQTSQNMHFPDTLHYMVHKSH